MTDEKFGFRVKQHRHWDTNEATGWQVHLPHQCQAWDIAGEDDYEGVPHAEAVAALERFLAEGAEALAELRAGREWDASGLYTEVDVP